MKNKEQRYFSQRFQEINEFTDKIFINIFIETLFEKVVKKLKKRVFSSFCLITYVSSWYKDKKFALNSEKTILKSFYFIWIMGFFKDSFGSLSYISVTLKLVKIWDTELRSGESSMLSLTERLVSQYWMISGLKFKIKW